MVNQVDGGRPTLLERFPSLASSDFRRIFINGFFTTGSRWTEVLARGWLVHELSDGSTGDVVFLDVRTPKEFGEQHAVDGHDLLRLPIPRQR